MGRSLVDGGTTYAICQVRPQGWSVYQSSGRHEQKDTVQGVELHRCYIRLQDWCCQTMGELEASCGEEYWTIPIGYELSNQNWCTSWRQTLLQGKDLLRADLQSRAKPETNFGG